MTCITFPLHGIKRNWNKRPSVIDWLSKWTFSVVVMSLSPHLCWFYPLLCAHMIRNFFSSYWENIFQCNNDQAMRCPPAFLCQAHEFQQVSIPLQFLSTCICHLPLHLAPFPVQSIVFLTVLSCYVFLQSIMLPQSFQFLFSHNTAKRGHLVFTYSSADWLLNNIKARKLSYFSHLKRHDSLEKHIFEARLEGKRRKDGLKTLRSGYRWAPQKLAEKPRRGRCLDGWFGRQRPHRHARMSEWVSECRPATLV